MRTRAAFLPLLATLAVLGLGLLPGCVSRDGPRPGRTNVSSKPQVIPAQVLGNFMLVQAKWDRYGPYTFLIDTGSSSTLVTPDLAERYGEESFPASQEAPVQVRSASGQVTVLAPATIRHLQLGRVSFEDVPVLTYDCSAVSSVLGIQIDGILGFPLFRSTLLTLDYPHRQLILQAASADRRLPPGHTVPFNNTKKTPIIPVRLGDKSFVALIDSGSDAMLSVNPFGLEPKFAYGPRPGPTESTLTGDRLENVGRLADTFYLGEYALQRPIAQVTDALSSIGGGILKHFIVTFDQAHDQVTFLKPDDKPISLPSWRGSGMSYSKTAAYWKVVGVVPDSPADKADVQNGDLITKVNGEPVSTWSYQRFEQLTQSADDAVFTFLNGTQESTKRIGFATLIP